MPSPSPLAWVSATLPKSGHSETENEDAAAADPRRMRFAVADGATEGWQSGAWAKRLAGEFARTPPSPARFADWLAGTRTWAAPQAAPATAGAWYVEVKQKQGSFATFAGLEFHAAKDGEPLLWRAVAVGDSCLVHVRGGKVACSFPVASAEKFGSRPALISSIPDAACPEPQWRGGKAEPGDLFALATDAVAAELLRASGQPEWVDHLVRFHESITSADPAALVNFLTLAQSKSNDDVTMTLIRVSA